MQPDTSFTKLILRLEAGVLIVEGPWQSVEALHTYLHDHGMEASLCADPIHRRASLEFPSGTDVEAVSRLLHDWAAQARSKNRLAGG